MSHKRRLIFNSGRQKQILNHVHEENTTTVLTQNVLVTFIIGFQVNQQSVTAFLGRYFYPKSMSDLNNADTALCL